jgi:hypothetical protein
VPQFNVVTWRHDDCQANIHITIDLEQWDITSSEGKYSFEVLESKLIQK